MPACYSRFRCSSRSSRQPRSARFEAPSVSLDMPDRRDQAADDDCFYCKDCEEYRVTTRAIRPVDHSLIVLGVHWLSEPSWGQRTATFTADGSQPRCQALGMRQGTTRLASVAPMPNTAGCSLAKLGAEWARAILVGAFQMGSEAGTLWTTPAVMVIIADKAREAIVTVFLLLVVMALSSGWMSACTHQGLNALMMSASPDQGNCPEVFILWDNPPPGPGKTGL